MTKVGTALVALGSNLDLEGLAPAGIVAAAMDLVAEFGTHAARSRLWRSPAWPPGGPDYVNAVLRFDTDLGPEALLGRLHEVEARFGRTRETRWGARTLDLDLIAWGQMVRPDAATQAAWRSLDVDRQGREAPDRLILPHPRLQDRAFVLAPLAEVAADWRHPLTGQDVRSMLAALPPRALEGTVPLDPA